MTKVVTDIFHAQFSTPEVAEATGVPATTIYNWVRPTRRLITGQHGKITGGGQHGVVRNFSFRNAIEIGLANALLAAGLGDVSHAFAAAAHLAHSGVGASKLHPARIPGCPYQSSKGAEGETLLCVRADQSKIVWHPIGRDVLANVYAALGDGFVMIRVDPVFEHVVRELGYDHFEVLKFAYGRSRS